MKRWFAIGANRSFCYPILKGSTVGFWSEFLDAGKAALFPRLYEMEKEQRRREQQRFGEVAIRAYRRARQMDAQQNRDVQYEDDDCVVRVKNGYHFDSDKDTTDILVIDRNSRTGAGWHVVFDDNGNVIHEGWKSRRG